MAIYGPKKNTAFSLYLPLVTSNSSDWKATPTIAAGDIMISKDGGAFANPDTLPDENPNSSKVVLITLTATEMNADIIVVRAIDQTAAKEWQDTGEVIYTRSVTVEDLATQISVNTIDDFLDTEIGAIKAKTDNLPTDPADESSIQAAIAGISSLSQADVRTAIGLASANLDAQLTAIDDYIDSEVTAIKAKTDNLPSDPADQSAVEAAITAGIASIPPSSNSQVQGGSCP